MGDLAYPLVSDLKREIAEAYGVLSDEGIALRGLFIIDKEVGLGFRMLALPSTCLAFLCCGREHGLQGGQHSTLNRVCQLILLLNHIFVHDIGALDLWHGLRNAEPTGRSCAAVVPHVPDVATVGVKNESHTNCGVVPH